MGIALECCERTKIGAMGSCMPGGSSADALEAFQAVVAELEDMERAGRLEITFRHRESQSGRRLTDHIQFKRLT